MGATSPRSWRLSHSHGRKPVEGDAPIEQSFFISGEPAQRANEPLHGGDLAQCDESRRAPSTLEDDRAEPERWSPGPRGQGAWAIEWVWISATQPATPAMADSLNRPLRGLSEDEEVGSVGRDIHGLAPVAAAQSPAARALSLLRAAGAVRRPANPSSKPGSSGRGGRAALDQGGPSFKRLSAASGMMDAADQLDGVGATQPGAGSGRSSRRPFSHASISSRQASTRSVTFCAPLAETWSMFSKSSSTRP